MARLLMPDDYGVIGILLVFISFSTLFIDGGLTTALIQKSNRTEKDFNTAFTYNIITSIFLYLFLYVVAPRIANFYGNLGITSLIRVLSLSLIIAAFSSVQNTKLQIDLDFKSLSIISVSSGVISGLVGVLMAYYGFGVWALVFQQVSNSLIKTITLNIVCKWKARFFFCQETFKELFSFGYKLVLTNCIGRIYDNLYPLIIGKLYPFNSLGYYTRGYQFANFPGSILNNIFLSVSFPVMSSIKEDENRLKSVFRKYIMMSSFVIFPLMFLFIVISEPLIRILLTDNWIGAVPFLRILCLGLMFQSINSINLNLLFVKGRSDLALKLELIKKSTAIIILLLSVFGGLMAICVGQSLYIFLATILNSFYTKRLIHVDYLTQVRDFGGVWILSLIALGLSWGVSMYINNDYLNILLSSLVFCIVYTIGNMLFKTRQYLFIMEILKSKYI